jgi:cobalt-zinc-cadmium efflux system outer membrane protein
MNTYLHPAAKTALLFLLVTCRASAQVPAEHQHAPAPQTAQPDRTAAARQINDEGPALTLAEIEQMALNANPTLGQAAAEIRAATGRRRQAGLYPNPVVGYLGEEIRGATSRGGEQGFFLRQDIILGGKLGLNRQVFDQERQQAITQVEEQKLRVLNNVRLFYFQLLAAQKMVQIRTDLLRLAKDAVQTSQQLKNVGQADEPDILQGEVEAQQAELALIAAEQR